VQTCCWRKCPLGSPARCQGETYSLLTSMSLTFNSDHKATFSYTNQSLDGACDQQQTSPDHCEYDYGHSSNIHTPGISIDLHPNYPHMPIRKVWIYRLLFVFLFVQLRISPARIKLAASNIAQWFMGVLGRESPFLQNFAPLEAQNLTNWPGTATYSFIREGTPQMSR